MDFESLKQYLNEHPNVEHMCIIDNEEYVEVTKIR